MPKAGFTRNPKPTTDYTDDTDGEANVTKHNPFPISGIRAIRGSPSCSLSLFLAIKALTDYSLRPISLARFPASHVNWGR
jgi:hypothetical protein